MERYWYAVDENLRDGPLRLLFVADELPRELRRVIGFLNEHMPRIEVLGVEVRHYLQGDMRALVPRVIGQTEKTLAVGGSTASIKKTTQSEFLGRCPAWAQQIFEHIWHEASSRGLAVSWGTKGFSVRSTDATDQPISILFGYPPGAFGISVPSFEVYLKHLDAASAAQLRAALTQHSYRAKGQYTMALLLSQEAVSQADASLVPIWEAYDQVGL